LGISATCHEEQKALKNLGRSARSQAPTWSQKGTTAYQKRCCGL